MLVAVSPGFSLLFCPSPIAVHDDGNMIGKVIYIQLILKAHRLLSGQLGVWFQESVNLVLIAAGQGIPFYQTT